MPDPLRMAGRNARMVQGAVPATPPVAGRSWTSVELAGRSPVATRLREVTLRAAPLDTGALIVAMPGADAESLARELHHGGRRAGGPFVAVACGDASVDRLLFGESTTDDGGPSDLESVTPDSRIAAARSGTLFLHDVAELPAAVQSRLARVARDGEVRIAHEPTATAMRLVASAAPGIDADVREHRFRLDLFRRLSVSRIDLPPLGDRRDDVPAIAARIVEQLCAAGGFAPRTLSASAQALLAVVSWPGHVAELRDVLHRIVASTPDAPIDIEHLLPALRLDRAPSAFVPSGTLREARLRFERDYIAAVLQHHRWRMAEAAHTLGIQRPNLYRKARQLGIPLARASE